MTDSTTNRTETAGHRPGRAHACHYCADLFDGLRSENERLRGQLAVAYDVIRRLRDGWTLVPTPAPWGHEWHGPNGELEATSLAHEALLAAVAGPNDQPDDEPAEPERTVMAMVAGRSFACEACSANVFVEITEPGDVKPRYRCNGCGAEYEGTWPPAAGPNDTEDGRDA